MRLTDIKSQQNSKYSYSIFIDNKYSFSLSQSEILNQGLKIGKELSHEELKKLKLISSQDKLYVRTLKLVAARPKSEWEVKTYLERKGASPALVQEILNKLRNIDLVNDHKFAEVYVRSLRLHSPASRRKIIAKLKQKNVKAEAIEEAIKDDDRDDKAALLELIEHKKSRYPDKTKFMAYLARQGFNYSDIKEALEN